MIICKIVPQMRTIFGRLPAKPEMKQYLVEQ